MSRKVGPIVKSRSPSGIEEITENNKETATLFNQYFISIFNKDKAVYTKTFNLISTEQTHKEPTIMFDQESIINTIKKLKKTKHLELIK